MSGVALIDVVETKTAPKRQTKKSKEMEESLNDKLNSINSFVEISKSVDDYAVRDESFKVVRKICSDVSDTYNTERVQYFKENGNYPKSIEKKVTFSLDSGYYRDSGTVTKELSTSTTTKLNSSPRSTVGAIIKLVNSLKLTVMPWDYLNPDSYKHESFYTNRAIKNFGTMMKDKVVLKDFEVYVLSPIMYLDVWNAVKEGGEDIKQVVTNPDHQNILDSVMLTIPTFRNIVQRVDVIEKDMNLCKQQVSQIQGQISMINDRISANERNILFNEAKIQGMDEKFANIESRVDGNAAEIHKIWCAMDPLLFAVKKGTNIMFDMDTEVYLGPCWGPEFPEIMVGLKGLVKNGNAGKKMNSKIIDTWGS